MISLLLLPLQLDKEDNDDSYIESILVGISQLFLDIDSITNVDANEIDNGNDAITADTLDLESLPEKYVNERRESF